MAGDAYFRINACYKAENFAQAKVEPQEVVISVESAINEFVSKKTGCERQVLGTIDSVKWHGMVEDMVEVSLLFPELVIVLEKQLKDTSLFDDDRDTFTKYAFWDGKYCECEGVVTYSENYKF